MCVNIANVLHEAGHDVTLCATRAGGPLEKAISPGVNKCILYKRNSSDFNAFRRLLNIVKGNRIQVIHAHSSSLFWAIFAKILCGKVKVIWHDHLGLRVSDRKKNPFYKLLSGKIDGIIAVNQELADWSRNNMKVPAERIVMINNFPLLTSVGRHPDPEFFTIACLANLRPQKGHETLVKAIALLRKHDLPKKLKVIFAGSLEDHKYRQRIRSLIAELLLEETIEMPGTVEDTSALLAKADCGVLSSSSEGLPVSLLEYGMAALPVVVTDVGQCAMVAGNGKYAKVVKPGEAHSMADELFWIIMNPVHATALGEGFKEQISANYGPESFIRNYSNLLNLITLE